MPEGTVLVDFTTEGAAKRNRPGIEVFKRLADNKSAMVGLCILLLFVLIAIFAPVIAPYRYDQICGGSLQGPSAEHLFGTDSLGRDLFSRVIYGTRYSITLGAGATLIGVLSGMLIGSLSGYYGGPIDELIMRISDVIQSVPAVLLNMALSVAFGSGFINTMIALGVAQTAGVARLQRSAILNVRRMEYLEAANAINCSDARIIVKHVLPNSFAPILVYATMEIGHVIMSAAGLSFLGLGVQPPTPEWGALLSSGRDHLKKHSYLTLFPGIFLVLFVLSINLLGDGLRDALDPKLKK